mmetsp:Transcript_22948/g.23213  ORF Transcript_22948/g.23213 Transcript_22948/m.23213 type:complete len:131 (+) Transcript_22948:155-547(+)
MNYCIVVSLLLLCLLLNVSMGEEQPNLRGLLPKKEKGGDGKATKTKHHHGKAMKRSKQDKTFRPRKTVAPTVSSAPIITASPTLSPLITTPPPTPLARPKQYYGYKSEKKLTGKSEKYAKDKWNKGWKRQ